MKILYFKTMNCVFKMMNFAESAAVKCVLTLNTTISWVFHPENHDFLGVLH